MFSIKEKLAALRMRKEAGPMPDAGRVGQWVNKAHKVVGKDKFNPLTALALSGAAVLGIDVLSRPVKNVLDNMKKEKYLNAAVAFDPDVDRMHKVDPVAVTARFNTLFTFNRTAAKDPLVASSWIKQTMEMPAVTPSVVLSATPRKDQLGDTEGLFGKSKKDVVSVLTRTLSNTDLTP